MHLFGMEDYCENIRIKIKESLEATVYNPKYLLRYSCLQKSIVLIFFTDMIVTFIGQELFCIKIMLPYAIQSVIVKIV